MRRIYHGIVVALFLVLMGFFIAGVLHTYFAEPAAIAAGSYSGRPRQVFVDGELTPMGFHQYTDLDTACGLDDHGTYTIPAGAHLAWIQPMGQNVRWRDFPRTAGVTTPPTAAIGQQIAAGDPFWYPGNLLWITFIEEAAGAEMFVSFYGM